MNLTIFYRQQAAQQQRAADEASLPNARDRAQGAADAWTNLARRSERANDERARIAVERDAPAPLETPDGSGD